MSTTFVIDSRRTAIRYWRHLWQYRKLFYALSWRDVVVRYKQTAFGAAWVWFQPILTIAIFTVVFGKLAKVAWNGLPYETR